MVDFKLSQRRLLCTLPVATYSFFHASSEKVQSRNEATEVIPSLGRNRNVTEIRAFEAVEYKRDTSPLQEIDDILLHGCLAFVSINAN